MKDMESNSNEFHHVDTSTKYLIPVNKLELPCTDFTLSFIFPD